MPSKEEVGSDGISATWLVIQHSSKKWISKYLTQFKGLAEQDELSWTSYYMMEDRLAMLEGRPQKYGTQIQNGKLYKVHNIDSVHARRAEYGFESLDEYLKLFGIDY